MYADKQSYTTADDSATGLKTIEPSLTYVAVGTVSAGPKDVSVNAGAAAWYGAALSKTDTCFYIKDTASHGTEFPRVPRLIARAPRRRRLPAYTSDGW